MSDKSKIEWTNATWPVIAGCDYLSPGCANCYAVRDARRLGSNPHPKVKAAYEGIAERHGLKLRWTGKIRLLQDRLLVPLEEWRTPRKVFVCNESDLFHEEVPEQFIARVWATMLICQHHTFQVLTKRIDRARWLLQQDEFFRLVGYWAAEHLFVWKYGDLPKEQRTPEMTVDSAAAAFRVVPPEVIFKMRTEHILQNVWIGTSAENQRFADQRITDLLHTPAAVRFVSVEPMLGPIDLRMQARLAPGTGKVLVLQQPDWIIVGGESGHGARRFDVAWARSIIAQCRLAGVPVFVKQLGARPVDDDAKIELDDRKGGNPDEWPDDLRVREFPIVRAIA